MAQFIPSPMQSAIFDFVEDPRGGNAIVEAVAGAGKTTTLVEAVKRMRGDVCLVAFNTKMAAELRERTGGMANVRAKTFHAIGKGQLARFDKRFGERTREPDDKKVLRILDQMIRDIERAELAEIVPAVAKIVGMAKQRGIGVDGLVPDVPEAWQAMIDHFGLADDLPETYEDRMDIVICLARKALRRSNEIAKLDAHIDFDDMVYLPLLWNLRFYPQDWVLVDEAQDTNPTRRETARRMVKRGTGRLIAVGDPRQAIYGFSGADNDALDQIGAQFHCARLPLTVTYRCPKAVVSHAQHWVSHIEAHESAPEGSVTEINYADFFDAVQPGDAVLCRYNKYLVSAAFRFIRMGRPARIEGRSIGAGLVALSTKWKVKKLDVLADRVHSWIAREEKKWLDKDNDTKAGEVRDRGETLLVLIEGATEKGITDVAGLRKFIEDLFDDRVVDNKAMITLCSAHRSKGHEWQRVFILGRSELMGRECRQYWQTEQELNLIYVAVTRAQSELIEVVGVKEEKRPGA